ncbi:unnamed protein product [Mycena citricolor]|uniref:Uncharacterized protein n=1 Tax=Mycena citricolor TaxID=2018698 RepID=A0AAD2K5Y6_9AGAR|nr:unnamed protein product [Mycena citricolor]
MIKIQIHCFTPSLDFAAPPAAPPDPCRAPAAPTPHRHHQSCGPRPHRTRNSAATGPRSLRARSPRASPAQTQGTHRRCAAASWRARSAPRAAASKSARTRVGPCRTQTTAACSPGPVSSLPVHPPPDRKTASRSEERNSVGRMTSENWSQPAARKTEGCSVVGKSRCPRSD